MRILWILCSWAAMSFVAGCWCASPFYPGVDSSLPGVDSSLPDVDSSLPDVDSSLPDVDSSLPGVDSAVPFSDSAVTGTDSAVVGTDSGGTDSAPMPFCGDGVVDPGEPCDDGNNGIQTDACLDGCIAAGCGDGWVWSGMELCDDGNNGIQTDACLDGCIAAGCGDGWVWSGMEECDDGNTVSGDGCDAACNLEGACTTFAMDGFGYVGCSDAPPILPCDDISFTGTDASLTDDSYVYVPLGFTFDFYGIGYTMAGIGSNGTVYFQDAYLGLGNVCIPGTNSYTPQRFVAVFWDDLNPASGSGTVRYQMLGVAPNRRFVVQWNVQRYSSTPNMILVRAILYEGSNDIAVCYEDAAFGSASYDYGLSATTGIQDSPALGLQFSCNTASLFDGLLLRYLHP